MPRTAASCWLSQVPNLAWDPSPPVAGPHHPDQPPPHEAVVPAGAWPNAQAPATRSVAASDGLTIAWQSLPGGTAFLRLTTRLSSGVPGRCRCCLPQPRIRPVASRIMTKGLHLAHSSRFAGSIAANVSVGFLCTPADSATAAVADLVGFLERAGFEITGPTGAATCVVVISPDAVMSDTWRARVDALGGIRPVPFAIHDLDSSLVPTQLADLNWVLAEPRSPLTAFGRVLAAIVSDPKSQDELRTIRAEADAWEDAGRPTELLTSDRHRARAMEDLLREVENNLLHEVRSRLQQYVQASSAHARKASWSHVRRRTGVFAAVGVLVAALLAVPSITVVSRLVHSMGVGSGDSALMVPVPQWSGVQAGALILDGTAEQKDLGRIALRRALALPWSPTGIEVPSPFSVEGMQPLEGGEAAAMLLMDDSAHSYLTLFDVSRGRFVWRVPVGLSGHCFTLSPDGRNAVVVNRSAIVGVDLRTRAVHEIAPSRGNLSAEHACLSVVWTRAGDISYAIDDGEIKWLRPKDGTWHSSGPFSSVSDLRATGDASVRALAALDESSYGVIDAETGRILATTSMSQPTTALRFRITPSDQVPAGTLSPSGDLAVVQGPDRQLWSFSPGAAATPTGIALPEGENVIRLMSGDRLLMAGHAYGVKAVLFPGGAPIGRICPEMPHLQRLTLSADDSWVACLDRVAYSLAPVPAAPFTGPVSMSTSLSSSVGPAGIAAEGREVVATRTPAGGKALQTSRFIVFADPVAAVAVSEDGSRALLASTGGAVEILSLRGPAVTPVVTWHLPGGGGAIGVSWSSQGPVVQSGAGTRWLVPDCADCDNDAGLIAALRSRIRGCMTELQLKNVSDSARRRLGLHLCVPVSETLP
jgi:hypothetical protein